MSIQLPPLNSLRVFEAAARHLSFTKAAEELHVTPAAVSQQVKNLEEHFGVQLFRRGTRMLHLTDAARAVVPTLREGFDKLTEVDHMLREREFDRLITVSVPPTFGAKWLVPRLERFQQRYPDYDLRLDASDKLVDFRNNDIDCAVRYGRGAYEGLESVRVLDEITVPVCSPALLEGDHPLRTPDDLRHHTLLHAQWRALDDAAPNWPMWLQAAGLTDIDTSRGPRFNIETFIVQAAIAGQGVALVSSTYIADDIEHGRLVQPFPAMPNQSTEFTHYVVYPIASKDNPKVLAFRDWIVEEAASDETLV